MSDAAHLFPADPVLIVDDEEQILKAVRTRLMMAGINNVTAVSDSTEVPGLLEQHPFSAITLDLSMPGIPGQALIPKIVGIDMSPAGVGLIADDDFR